MNNDEINKDVDSIVDENEAQNNYMDFGINSNSTPVEPVPIQTFEDFLSQQNLEPVAPLPMNEYVEVTPLQDQNMYSEMAIDNSTTPVDTVSSYEPVMTDNTVNTVVEPVSSIGNFVESESFTEIPVASVTDAGDREIMEHPDAKVTLKRKEAYNIKRKDDNSEQVDKGTLMFLLWIFIGLAAFVVALPYIFQVI